MIFVILFKMGKIVIFILVSFLSFLFFLSFFGSWAGFYSCHKTDKNFKSLYGFGGRWLTIRDVCMDFELCFKVHNFVSVHPESIKLGQVTNLTVIFHVVVSIYRLLKIWNSPQFPAQPRKLRDFKFTEVIIIEFHSRVNFHFLRLPKSSWVELTACWVL